jgi:phosphohistidine phosphatase
MAPASAIRRLVLLRHAKAEERNGSPDTLRTLALAGRKQAGRAGTAMVARDIIPELVLCSDAVRTRQTWDRLKAAFGENQPEVIVTPNLYTGQVWDVLELVAGVDESVRTVLVVGHEPAMSSVAACLAGAGSEPVALSQVQIGVPTASFSILDSALPWAQWDAQTAILSAVVRSEG